jgi:hypothetical protein
MKKYFLFLIALYFLNISTIYSQNSFYISPNTGFRILSSNLPGTRRGGKVKWITAPVIGLEIGKRNKPLYFVFQKDWYLNITPYSSVEISNLFDYSLNQYWTENNFLLNYNFGKEFHINMGYYFMFRENEGNIFSANYVRKWNGLLYGITKKIDWFSISLRNKIVLNPGFDALGDAVYSLILTTNFKGNTINSKRFAFEKNISIRATLGSRFFYQTGDTLLNNEAYPTIGIMPTVGVEVLIKKSNLSLNFEKDFWINFNGGSPIREIKGLVMSNFLAVKYHHKLKNERNIRFGVGYSYIRDLEQYRYITPANERRFSLFQMKGIGVSLSYQLFENTDIEVKHTFPTARLNEPFFNPKRLSLGVIWRLQSKNE